METERVIAFRSHWGFQSEYCNPASGNEKGGVERALGWYRRNWLVPFPEAGDLEKPEPATAGGLHRQPEPDDRGKRYAGGCPTSQVQTEIAMNRLYDIEATAQREELAKMPGLCGAAGPNKPTEDSTPLGTQVFGGPMPSAPIAAPEKCNNPVARQPRLLLICNGKVA